MSDVELLAQDMTTAGSVIVRQSSTKSAVDDKGLDDRPPSGPRLCCGADPLLVATIAGLFWKIFIISSSFCCFGNHIYKSQSAKGCSRAGSGLAPAVG